jgi:hypothetical protein
MLLLLYLGDYPDHAARGWILARPEGFEPSTYRLEGGCSIH